MYFKNVLVKFEDGWPWPIFEVTGVNLNMKICNFSLVNTITQQILIALGPNLSHGCISGVSWLSLKMDELDLYVEVIGLISKLNLFHYKHDKHVTQSSSKMDDLDLSFFVRKCMFMTSPHSARRWISLRCAGNMHSSYYKWNMAIICNPPIMLCATFVPCFIFGYIYHIWFTHPYFWFGLLYYFTLWTTQKYFHLNGISY